MPAISLFRLKPAQAFRSACSRFDQQSAAHACRLNQLDYTTLRNSFADSGQFRSVGLADSEHPYSVAIATAFYHAPQADNTVVKVDATVFWFDQMLDRFHYTLPAVGSRTRSPDDPDAQLLAASITSHLIRDMQQTGTFTTDRLHTRLQSSRYRDELKANTKIGEFTYEGMQVLHNPTYGAALRYMHNHYAAAYLDVFVYPILDWRFEDTDLLAKEAAGIRRDLHQLESSEIWRNLELKDTRQITLQDSGTPALVIEGEFRNTDDELLATTAHVYMQGDKFVKVRASYPKFAPVGKAVESFIQALPASLQVPAESRFMARLRKDWRNSDTVEP